MSQKNYTSRRRFQPKVKKGKIIDEVYNKSEEDFTIENDMVKADETITDIVPSSPNDMVKMSPVSVKSEGKSEGPFKSEGPSWKENSTINHNRIVLKSPKSSPASSPRYSLYSPKYSPKASTSNPITSPKVQLRSPINLEVPKSPVSEKNEDDVEDHETITLDSPPPKNTTPLRLPSPREAVPNIDLFSLRSSIEKQKKKSKKNKGKQKQESPIYTKKSDSPSGSNTVTGSKTIRFDPHVRDASESGSSRVVSIGKEILKPRSPLKKLASENYDSFIIPSGTEPVLIKNTAKDRPLSPRDSLPYIPSAIIQSDSDSDVESSILPKIKSVITSPILNKRTPTPTPTQVTRKPSPKAESAVPLASQTSGVSQTSIASKDVSRISAPETSTRRTPPIYTKNTAESSRPSGQPYSERSRVSDRREWPRESYNDPRRRDSYNGRRESYNDRRESYNDRRESYNDQRESYNDRRESYNDSRRRESYNDRRESYNDSRRRESYNDQRESYNDSRRRESYNDQREREPPYDDQRERYEGIRPSIGDRLTRNGIVYVYTQDGWIDDGDEPGYTNNDPGYADDGRIPIPEPTEYYMNGIPNYGLLTREQQLYIRTRFNIKFDMLRETWPQYMIPSPPMDMPLAHVHLIYNHYVKHIYSRESAQTYTLYIIVAWLIMEIICVKLLKLPAGGFTKFRMNRMGKYKMLLIQLGEKYNQGDGYGSGWPVEVKILVISIIEMLVFIAVRWLLGFLDENATESTTNFITDLIDKQFGITGVRSNMNANIPEPSIPSATVVKDTRGDVINIPVAPDGMNDISEVTGYIPMVSNFLGLDKDPRADARKNETHKNEDVGGSGGNSAAMRARARAKAKRREVSSPRDILANLPKLDDYEVPPFDE
jgi:hypothetical protein